MFVWEHCETARVEASARAVWRLWADVDTWPAWDADLDWVRLEGAFVTGARGRMKPKSGPPVDFTIDLATAPTRFRSVAHLPLTRLAFDHVYEDASGVDPARVRHAVRMEGWLAPVFGWLIGRTLRRTLPDVLTTLGRLALETERRDVDRSTERRAP